MTNTRAGAPLWADLMTTDVQKAKTFYRSLLGWDFTDTGEEYGHYVPVSAGPVSKWGQTRVRWPGSSS